MRLIESRETINEFSLQDAVSLGPAVAAIDGGNLAIGVVPAHLSAEPKGALFGNEGRGVGS